MVGCFFISLSTSLAGTRLECNRRSEPQSEYAFRLISSLWWIPSASSRLRLRDSRDTSKRKPSHACHRRCWPLSTCRPARGAAAGVEFALRRETAHPLPPCDRTTRSRPRAKSPPGRWRLWLRVGPQEAVARSGKTFERASRQFPGGRCDEAMPSPHSMMLRPSLCKVRAQCGDIGLISRWCRGLHALGVGIRAYAGRRLMSELKSAGA
jgi:hypothetical protein